MVHRDIAVLSRWQQGQVVVAIPQGDAVVPRRVIGQRYRRAQAAVIGYAIVSGKTGWVGIIRPVHVEGQRTNCAGRRDWHNGQRRPHQSDCEASIGSPLCSVSALYGLLCDATDRCIRCAWCLVPVCHRHGPVSRASRRNPASPAVSARAGPAVPRFQVQRTSEVRCT